MVILKGAAIRTLMGGFALSVLSVGYHAATSTPVQALTSQPANPIPAQCRKYINQPKKLRKCVRAASSQLKPDDLFTIGYWQAQAGDYAAAIETLKRAEASGDPRILTYIGFATRKLGDVETAMDYYNRALARNPDYVEARAYMGEAFLQKGELAGAKVQLEEIVQRCGGGCEAYASLDAAIKRYRAKAS